MITQDFWHHLHVVDGVKRPSVTIQILKLMRITSVFLAHWYTRLRQTGLSALESSHVLNLFLWYESVRTSNFTFD